MQNTTNNFRASAFNNELWPFSFNRLSRGSFFAGDLNCALFQSFYLFHPRIVVDQNIQWQITVENIPIEDRSINKNELIITIW